MVTLPSSPPAQGLYTLKSTFHELSVPLSADTTTGASTSLKFIRVTLDTLIFQTTLQNEKLLRTSLLISNHLLAHCCTKHQLLSLFGHLNYAIRIIPQSGSFTSLLLSLSPTIQSLHTDITLDDSDSEDIQLYTDTAFLVGFLQQ